MSRILGAESAAWLILLVGFLSLRLPAGVSIAAEDGEGWSDIDEREVVAEAEGVGQSQDSDAASLPNVRDGDVGAINIEVVDRPPILVYGDIEMSSECAPDEARVEVIWIDPDTGQWTDYEGFRCLPRSQIHNDGGGAPPGASAEAPARDSVAEAIPDRVVRINPHPRGMTGMDTWLWYDDDGDEATAPTTELTVAASVPDVTVTATAAISSYCWDVDGDGSDEVCTDAPGSEEQPAFTHVYESTGTYQVHLTVTWAGSFSVNGAPPVAFDPVQRTYSIAYDVIQVRSVLTG